MWGTQGHQQADNRRSGVVAVAIDTDKGSQYALKWAVDNLLSKGKTVVLIHVRLHNPHHPPAASLEDQLDKQTKDLFVSFHCYCTRKDIHPFDVTLDGTDVVRAITEYVSYAAIEYLVLGASSRHGFIRFKSSHISSNVSKGAPDFCTVYVISKGKVSSMRNASRPAPYASPLVEKFEDVQKNSPSHQKLQSLRGRRSRKPLSVHEDSLKSVWGRGRGSVGYFSEDHSETDTDISFVSSGRPSTDRGSSIFYEAMDPIIYPRHSSTSDRPSLSLANKLTDISIIQGFSSVSQESGSSHSSQNLDDVEAEMRRLKMELKQTMDMYSTACKEALSAKQKALELQQWRWEEERRLDEARLGQEAAVSVAEKERNKCIVAIEAAEAQQKIAELEAQRRLKAEMKALKDAEEIKKFIDTVHLNDLMYRKYSIEEIEEATNQFAESGKIGEGGYGPVYKCFLDYTPVAVKVLRPDAAQGRSQFQQEVDVLSRIRHPNMVLLLGACPEYGCLVYEYMSNGSLEDRLFQKGGTPVLSWQHRFRIAAEVATGLMFLHQSKPEPLVHRDLKPGNILLDHSYVSKISDVGLARLVPPEVAENVTQYRMTSTAGTFCYIDPEYQQTGMLGVKSDVYSLGVMLLQLVTGKPPMGLTHFVAKSIEKGEFEGMLDPQVDDWPLEETKCLAKLALQCAELRRRDRPDLGKVVLPELNRLREFAAKSAGNSQASFPHHSHSCSSLQEVMSDSQGGQSGSSLNYSNASAKTTA
ncbi:hypothetical protein MLD38_004972 [Melastoma candidum]|uniref:Uncharacterized protein n=1 Tax=Melastoma candidum TaxID=119954 RepID=A0ACB9S7A7_9MYRT|nr:hypothetical protein MLD38_004972 [Melastoma candidum]